MGIRSAALAQLGDKNAKSPTRGLYCYRRDGWLRGPERAETCKIGRLERSRTADQQLSLLSRYFCCVFSKTTKEPVTKDDDVGIMGFALWINQIIEVIRLHRLAKGHVKLATRDLVPDVEGRHDGKAEAVDRGVDNHFVMGKARSLDAATV